MEEMENKHIHQQAIQISYLRYVISQWSYRLTVTTERHGTWYKDIRNYQTLDVDRGALRSAFMILFALIHLIKTNSAWVILIIVQGFKYHGKQI